MDLWLLQVVSAQTELAGEGRGLLSPPSAPSLLPRLSLSHPSLSVCLSALFAPDPRRLELLSCEAASLCGSLNKHTVLRLYVGKTVYFKQFISRKGRGDLREQSEDFGISQKYEVIVRFIVNKYVRTRRCTLNFITFEYIAPQRP